MEKEHHQAVLGHTSQSLQWTAVERSGGLTHWRTALPLRSSLTVHQTQLVPDAPDPGLCFHGTAALHSTQLSSQEHPASTAKTLTALQPQTFPVPYLLHKKPDVLSIPSNNSETATPSDQLGAPGHLLLVLSQMDGCTGPGSRPGKVRFRFCPGRVNHPSTFLFQNTTSHLVSSASGRLLRSSPHEAALMSSCTSAPGSLTSLSQVSGCQDTEGREKTRFELDLRCCKPCMFLSSPPPGEVGVFPMAKGGEKRKQTGKLIRPLQHVLGCPWIQPQETQEVGEVLHQQPLSNTQGQVGRLRQVSVAL